MQEIICIYPNIFDIVDGYNCSPNFQFCLEGKFRAVRWQQKYYISAADLAKIYLLPLSGQLSMQLNPNFCLIRLLLTWFYSLDLVTADYSTVHKIWEIEGNLKAQLLAVLHKTRFVTSCMHPRILEHSWFDGANCQNRPHQIHTNLCAVHAPCVYKFLLCNIIFKSFKAKLARQKAMSAQKKKVSYYSLSLTKIITQTLILRPKIVFEIDHMTTTFPPRLTSLDITSTTTIKPYTTKWDWLYESWYYIKIS